MLNLPYIKSRREALDLSLADAARLAGWGVEDAAGSHLTKRRRLLLLCR